MLYEAPYDYSITNDDAEAERRADHFRQIDPFEKEIPRALLSKEHIQDYVRVTGMLCPFYPDEDRLKSASYEAWPIRFIQWEDGKKIITDVDTGHYKDHGYELPANSITFAQIESKIRLPNYIALRFNLRITHVHRGLLLGTGPLVDPGFGGDLLIPLHNLTSEPYRMKGGVIWIEFTKTSAGSVPNPEFEVRKRRVGIETYFERASGNNPIQSSIPLAVKEAKASAQQAKIDARRAAKTNLFFASIGFLAILGMILAAANFGVSVVRDASQSAKDATQAITESRRLWSDSEALRKEVDETKRQVQELQGTVLDLRRQADQQRTVPPASNQQQLTPPQNAR